jgi:hypothetical protein
MATPSEKLAESLALLKSLQDQDVVAIRTQHLTRTHRERLLKNGFIQEVMKGWYISARPDEPAGESTGWYASFWGFCADYLNERFGKEWCIGPEQSLAVHTGNWTVPKQLLVRSPKGGNKPTGLIFGTSLFDLRLELPSQADTETKDSLRIMNLPFALTSISPAQFEINPIEMRTALMMIPDASELLRRLLEGGNSTVAGRLSGAFRNIGRDQIADAISGTMRSAGYTINESDPFADKPKAIFGVRETSPYVNRLRMQWENMREQVLENFPAAPGMTTDSASYLKQVEAAYVSDAYNSLSIEGYRVSTELIERVRSGNWNPESEANDRNHRDALAARGYWQAFQTVEASIGKVLAKNDPGSVVENDYGTWYRELFGPSVTAGIIKAADLAGFRNMPVYIRRSMHVPPRYEAVRELMPAFFDLLKEEKEPAVRVVLGHFMFVYIHPYIDGNGRMGRFLMNVMLASGGYPWTIVPVEKRNDYMAALESASVDQDIKPFTLFLAGLINKKK